ncbi:tagatose-6-phosphate ketose isomerase [Alishewanella longhuensis]|uniref:Tagatose-6-phosphate ketose isomerase n=1 Tax=Alishewanella longhuensis TaxID=1091037 RepID=A0ABQ3L552_9ALTE|nr:SIS domain-containing protein [Alishewanella longhuensis]GHG72366.1 tagatose-6-phosphate ketose isomerase [Alishewanella longhuensis]
MATENYLSLSAAELQQKKAYWTAREISQQPALWQQIASEHQGRGVALNAFLHAQLAKPNLRIILTGAGTSAYIGKALAATLQQQLTLGQRVEAIATTDLVSHPTLYLDARAPTLLISYGRSGNSPESIAAVDLAEQLLPQCAHLVITCNAEGKLAQFCQQQPDRSYLYALPAAAHDQSFAMTSSFSGMYLATLLSFNPEPAALNTVIALAEQVLSTQLATIKQQALLPCKRVVFLGSGPLQALAQEAALKYLELTAGAILSHYESPLGFRHGPKSLVDGDTFILLLESAQPYSRQYDQDLAAELKHDQQALALASLSLATLGSDAQLSDAWLLLPMVVWCQALACFKAMALGVSPDNPCPGGQVNRVVQGVTLYPLLAE